MQRAVIVIPKTRKNYREISEKLRPVYAYKNNSSMLGRFDLPQFRKVKR